MSPQNKKFIIWITLTLLIIAASIIDLRSIVKTYFIDQDKIFHIIIFTMFMVVTKLLLTKLSIIKNAAITFALGLLIELLQKYLPIGMRHFTFNDIIANTIGIALGVALLLLMKRTK